MVPVPPSVAPSARTRLYTVRRGDTLVTIADRFGVSLNHLRRWNGMTGIKVAPGRRLHVAEPAIARQLSHRRSTPGLHGLLGARKAPVRKPAKAWAQSSPAGQKHCD